MNKKLLFFSLIIYFVLTGCVSLKTPYLSNKRKLIVRYAKNFLNKKYEYGKSDPFYGFDCSGFTYYVYKKAIGMIIPRTSKMQYKKSIKISKNNLLPGDLVFFSIKGRGIDHVGIFIGNGKFIHSPTKGKRVKIANLNSSYWKKVFVSGGKFLK